MAKKTPSLMPTPRALQSSGNIMKYRAEEYWQILLVWFRNPQVHDWLWHGLCIFPPSVSDELRGMKKCARELMELKMRQHTQNAATCVQHTVGFMITRFRRRGKSSQISIQQRFGPWIYYKQFSASRGPISLPEVRRLLFWESGSVGHPARLPPYVFGSRPTAGCLRWLVGGSVFYDEENTKFGRGKRVKLCLNHKIRSGERVL